jgi:hypothetical protein
MKRKFRQWCSTIPSISAKSNNHLSPKITEHKTMTIPDDVKNSGPGLGEIQKCGGIKSINGILFLKLFFNIPKNFTPH